MLGNGAQFDHLFLNKNQFVITEGAKGASKGHKHAIELAYDNRDDQSLIQLFKHSQSEQNIQIVEKFLK